MPLHKSEVPVSAEALKGKELKSVSLLDHENLAMPRHGRRSSTAPSSSASLWERFIYGREDCPFLSEPALYCLPKRLIHILSSDVPGLLNEDDIAFEIALREHGASVFANRQAFLSSTLDSKFLILRSTNHPVTYPYPGFEEFPHAESILDLAQQVSIELDRNFQEMLSRTNANERILEQEHRQRTRIAEQIETRIRGYAGWLVTNPQYWVDALRAMAVGARDIFPVNNDPAQHRERTRGDVVESGFLTKWALLRVVTFFLPEPLRPGLFPGEPVPRNDIVPCGVSMFLPWPFLADQSFQFRGLADYYRTRNDLSHLRDWLERGKKWGADRYARMFELFVYLELALKQRYPNRVRGNLQAIESAFARYWRDDEADRTQIEQSLESVRRIRLKLQQRLESCKIELGARFDSIVSGQDSEWAENQQIFQTSSR